MKKFSGDITRLVYLSIIVLLIIAQSACAENLSKSSAGNQNSFTIAPIFREFYDQMGGESTLGKPISPPVQEENFIYQYTVNAVLVKATNPESQNEVLFSPVGLDFSLPPFKMKGPIREGEYYVHDIPIYLDFIPLYQKMGGQNRVGKPLTPLRYNPQKKRYEQLFEGVGFYFNETEPKGTVKLLAYGAWKCQDACIYPVSQDAKVILPKPIDPHFFSFVEQLGSDFTGFALAEAIQTKDGKIQQIFENVALSYDTRQNPTIQLVEIPEKLGILPMDLVNKTSDGEQVFIPLSGEKGHNVPREFMDYLNLHGGLEVVGAPINEASIVGNQTVWQCFKTICLEKDGQIEGIYQIHPSALGLEYLYLNKPQGGSGLEENTPPSQFSTATPIDTETTTIFQTTPIKIEITQLHDWVDVHTPQEIRVVITQNQLPIEGLIPYLIIPRPDGTPIQFPMPKTDAHGASQGQIPAISAPSGTLISYKVCIRIPDLPEQCAQGAYPIWTMPE